MNASALGRTHEFADLQPLLRRIAKLDPGSLVRLRRRPGLLTAFVRTPFQVTAARSITVGEADGVEADVTVAAAEFVSWLDGGELPQRRDAEWRWGVPPAVGWQHVDDVPGEVLRGLVSSGSRTLEEAAAREGVPGAQPRAEVADVLLDSVVLTVSNPSAATAEISLRTVSALVRLGFLPPDQQGPAVRVAVRGRWIRLAGLYGSVYAEAAPAGLSLGLSLKPI